MCRSIAASAASPARGPSASPTATARLSRTTGLSVRRASSSYHSTICTQSVSPAVGASACSAAIAAWAWNSPSRSRARAACRISTPSAIDRGVPPAAVLLGERHQPAVGGGAGRAAGVVEQHQGEQPRHLGVVDHGRELPGEPDRLGGEVDVAGVALVEDQVEHAQHGGDVAGSVEPHARRRCASRG